jgi:transposase-like protein
MPIRPASESNPLPPEKPYTLLDFARMFPTDEACAAYLFDLRWPDGFVCPKCSSTKCYVMKAAATTIQCANHHRTSVTASTVLHKTRTPLRLWFYGAYLVSTLTPGISALQFCKQLGIKRYETGFQLLHKLRSALVAPDREQLKGEVEVDEQFIGGHRVGGKRGRGTDQALVVTAVEIVWWQDKPGREGKVGHEREGHEGFTLEEGPPEERAEGEGIWRRRAGRVRMTVIPDAGADTLVPWVVANVEPGTIVYTDGWKSYGGLVDRGYDHRPFVKKGKEQPLPMIHLIISNVKRWLLGTHKGAVQPQHLQAYLNEYTFRFNRRFWRGPAFIRALGLSVHVEKWPEYETLYAGEWVHPNPEWE